MYDIISDVRRCLQKIVRTYAVYFNAQSFLSSKRPQRKKKQGQNFTQAYLRRAADVRKKIAPADMEKCPQKSAGFDKGMHICGFLADICGHGPTS